MPLHLLWEELKKDLLNGFHQDQFPRALSELTFQRNWIGIIWMSRKGVMIKIAKTGPGGSIEKPRPSGTAGRGTSVRGRPTSDIPVPPVHGRATYRPGKHRPAVGQTRITRRSAHDRTARTGRQRLAAARHNSRTRPIAPSDQEGLVPRPAENLRPIYPPGRTRRTNAKTLGHDRPDRADSRPRPTAGRTSRPTVRTVRSTRSRF
ncbi:unnamed protein product [Microthlaspi erraticum]|uniref:Uncharacterized protein n=1 Tax=Microthlaspi erraticum TaxID=1685480 RepID=A0A6D2IYY8_9BRAS|nr:unnamed protein product [Microthlaspi erraticum]